MPPHQRDARAKGIPALGSGVIYPVSEEGPNGYVVPDFEIPPHWPRAFALDVGWNRTACIWGAWDRSSDIVYEYSEYYVGEAPPQVHAEAIRSRGDWIQGVIDPASRGRSQVDGRALIDEYTSLGLNILPSVNEVEAGLFSVYRRLASGRLKTFASLQNVRAERRLYRRDDKGKIVKERDHLMDAERYLIMSGMARASTIPISMFDDIPKESKTQSITGY